MLMLCSCLLGGRLGVLEEAEAARFPLFPGRVGVEGASQAAAGGLEGADKSGHTGASTDSDGERTAPDAGNETGRTSTSGTVQRVVGLLSARRPEGGWYW